MYQTDTKSSDIVWLIHDIEHAAVTITMLYAAEQTIVAILDASLLIRSSGGMTDMSSQLWNNHSVKCEPWKDNECLTQGWASFSHEGPDLEKLWKPRAASWLKNKVKTSSFWRSQYTYDCDLQNIRSSPRFLFQFCTVEAYFVENHCYPWSLKDKKVIRSIQDESLSLRKCRRARIKGPAGRIWPVVCRCLL